MTRWVRPGSTQKHKKMPGEATKWGEFDRQKNKQNSRKKAKSNREMSFSKSNVSRSFDDRSKSNNNPTGNNKKPSFRKSINFPTTSKEESMDFKSSPNEIGSKKEHVNDKDAGISSPLKKKNKHLKKLQKKRADKGAIHLPSKVERKLYYIKKKLSEKGVPPNSVKEIIRKERTKAELNFRKTFNPSKLCFHCKKPGHILADCPEKLGTSVQETGFKSGSAEHISFKYPQKIQGRKCNFCGNINHLKKDCPSLNKQKTDESSITLHTIKEEMSVDAEVMDKNEMKRKKIKKPKIVKF